MLVSKTLTINQKPVRVHALSTGQVSVKTRFRETAFSGYLAQLSFLLDRSFTEWMPIWAWVIEHPEGVFLIDTGENARVNEKGYFKSSGWFNNWINTTQFKFQVRREEEIDRLLEKIGLSTNKIDSVILTHLHLDHIDGLSHFPDSEILVHDLEWENPYGDLPMLYPEGFAPTLVPLNSSYKNFEKAAFLTKDENLILVHTPGHTYGHCSALLRTDEADLLFAGDVCYNQPQLMHNRFSGADVSRKMARSTYQKIKNYAKDRDLVFLPSHDGDVETRLTELSFIRN